VTHQLPLCWLDWGTRWT